MYDENQTQNESDYIITREEELEIAEEGDIGGSRLNRPIIKISAVIILLTFIVFSFAWLPIFWPPHLDFLKQNQALSEEELVRQSKHAVVNIQATKTAGATRSQGTGFNLTAQGMIITNRHVVEGASAVEITFSDGKRLFSQDIDIIDGYDLAVIRLKSKNLPFLPLVTDQLVELGQTVTIIGNPRGFQRVSSRGEVKEYYQTETGMQVFTVAATIAPGSSGSPVLDEKGRLVGIVYATGTLTIDDKEQSRALAIPATALN
ncbi:Peptidase S1C [Syntrophomonas zehnderi OL-4]|uniref:Peptidase S1C n=1 Tax=Syntrophomonas zehnderi OL-4 TaxID=690567 RepID=A0A0E4C8I2_9FIRM|nr:serine protease [Syntrophomonas zehnderi]CFX46364.1 Peptidase S1C [Syntrophomonas zehnderi OL-4]